MLWCYEEINLEFENLGKEHVLEPSNPANLSMTSSNPESRLSIQSDSLEFLQNGALLGGAVDNPEALEVAKQQKDILEQGIELWVINEDIAVSKLKIEARIMFLIKI